MRQTLLPDEILMNIEQPARYIGGEFNSVYKDPSEYRVHFAMCFPDVYEIGMSHLGLQILYGMFNQMEDVYCERVFSPWPDLDAIMRQESIPLFSLETQTPLSEFDFLGITLQYELCYTNILQILELSGIPLYSRDRSEDDPIVIGGGPCTVNPEPLADFFDLIYLGDGEVSYDRLIALYVEAKHYRADRTEFLRRAANIDGIYVPSMYDVIYNDDGTIWDFTPIAMGDTEKDFVMPEPLYDIPRKVMRLAVQDLDKVYYPDAPVVPFIKATQDRVMLEVQRGCIRGCRFCQAGMIYRPNRERSVEFLKDRAITMLKNTGHDEISLISLSTSDYTELGELVDFILEDLKENRIELSLPSLRIDSFSLELMKKISGVNRSVLTVAPEAGSQRLRNVINKNLTEEEILDGAATAFKSGWNRVKLYFMLGLPTETDEDACRIPELAEKIAELYYDIIPKEDRKGKIQISMATSFFVPKPFTPFQWAPQITAEQYLDRTYAVQDSLKKQLNQKAVTYHWHKADASVIEGILARGDRRLSKVIKAVYDDGGIFEAWGEYFNMERWEKAMSDAGLEISFYTSRPRSKDEFFPWDFIDCGLKRDFLWNEWERAQKALTTKNCREACAGCGSYVYGGGICHERP